MIKFDAKEKKMLKIVGGIGLAGLAVWGIREINIRRREKDAQPAQAAGGAPEVPIPSGAAAAPKVNPATEWAPDAVVSFGSKRKKMVQQVQHVLNAIARIKGDPQIKADGVWGNKTEARAKKYLGKSSTTYNKIRAYAVGLYKAKGLSYPDGKPLTGTITGMLTPSINVYQSSGLSPAEAAAASGFQFSPAGPAYEDPYGWGF